MLTPADFAGRWTVERLIEDCLTGVPGRFDGVATFTPEDGSLRCREKGTLRLGDGPPFAATRETLWRWDGAGVEVLFGDGRPFHRFVPTGAGPGTDHPCGRDLYRVRYDLTAWPVWFTRWEVEGPAKSYAMSTTHRRA